MNNEKRNIDKIEETKLNINVFGKITRVFINQIQLTTLLILLIITLGLVGLSSLPKESLPEIVFPAITVQTLYPGASPEDVEFLVTEKIENKVKDFDDIDTIESVTNFGLSVVTINFIEGIDIERKKIEIDNALRELEFSDGVNDPTSVIFKTSEIPLMNISVAGNYSIDQLSSIAESVANGVEGVRGVEEVVLSGDAQREVQVVLETLDMMKYNVVFNDVRDAIGANNFSIPVGELSLNGMRFNLRIDEKYKTVEAIENTMIIKEGKGIYIKDVAKVYDTVENTNTLNRTYIKGINDKALPSVFLRVNRKVGSDVIGTSEAIHELLRKEEGRLYPEGTTVYISNDQAISVNKDLKNIQDSAFSGLIVVIIVLFLFIGIRESLVVSITIPLSLLGTLGVLSAFGISFNTFAILGLIVSLGLLVDNSIIVMENIDRLKKKGLGLYQASFYGTNQVALPIVSATMTTLAAFFPLAILPGILGAFVSTIPLTIMVTISVSLVISLVITPSLAARILQIKDDKKPINKYLNALVSTAIVAGLSFYAFQGTGGNNDLALIMMVIFSSLMLLRVLTIGDRGLEDSKVTDLYSRLITWIVKSKIRASVVVIIGLSVLVGSFTTFSTGLLKISFFPKAEPTSLTLTIETTGGMTLEDTNKVAESVEQMLYSIEGVSQFNTTVGGNTLDKASISIELDTSKVNGFRSEADIQEKIEKVIGANIYLQGIANGPPVGKPIELRIVGEDLQVMDQFSRMVSSYLNELPGPYNVASSSTTGVPQLIIDLNVNKGLIYGTTPQAIANQLRGEINGIVASTITQNNKEIDIVIKKEFESINDKHELDNLFVTTPQNNMLTLSSFAEIREQGGISNISRKDGERLITISSDLKAGYNASEVTELIRSRFDSRSLPEGLEIRYAGDVEGIQQNFGNLFQSMILAVFLVFIILTIQFKSIGQPFIILTTIPMAVVGVVWGLIVTGNEFGFYAFMGLISLVGIAVNDAIVLIDYINYLRLQGKGFKEAVAEAGVVRFNPVLATTLTTISGVLPLAFKESYYAQFSYALIFGLMMTTLLTLVFIPTIYALFVRKDKKIKKEVI